MKRVTRQEISTVAARLRCAYPYITDVKRSEGVFQDTPLAALVRAILSQHTNDINRDRAFAALRARYPNWEDVTHAPVVELAEVIRATNHAYTKAERLHLLLERVAREQGAYSLDVLRDWPTDEVLAYLQSFSGVGPKSAAVVCLFILNRPVMPVDTHVFRVAQRLGWLPARISPGRAHVVLQELLPDELIFPLHVGMWEHGHTTCRPAPRCGQCAVYEFCQYPAKTAAPPPVAAAIAQTAGRQRKAA